MDTPDQAVNRTLSRRNFLKLAAAGGVTLAAGYMLSESAPWLDYDQQTQLARSPLNSGSRGASHLRELVRYATLAANGHNAQAWKFAIQEDAITIYPDYARRLPIVDPDNREMWISLGCALENLLVAARATGYAPEVTYPDSDERIRVQLTPDTPHVSSLFDAIPHRQTTRSEYNGRPVEGALLDQFESLPLEQGVALRVINAGAEFERLVEYVRLGNLSQYSDSMFVEELIAWLRFTKKEALGTLDGLYTRSSGNPEVPRWLGQLFVSGTSPQQQADTDTRLLRSSPHALVIASEDEDKASWVRAGQVYERLALLMTALGIQSAFLNQPIEVAGIRSQFQSAMALGETLPQLLIRFGYGNPMPRSMRRPIDSILI